MRNILFYIFLICLANAAAAQYSSDASFFKEYGSFSIAGNIKNYIPTDHNGFVTFRTYNVTGRFADTSVLIDTNGNFECELHQAFEGDIGFIYEGDYITMYCIPSEKMTIEIDGSRWSKESQKIKAIRFGGVAALFSKWIIDFYDALSKTSFKTSPDLGNSKISDQAFADQRTSRMQEELVFLNRYIELSGIDNTKFRTWCRNDIIYKAGSEIARFGFLGKRNDKNTHFQLMRLLREIPVSNESALNNSVYYDFLNALAGGFQIIINLNPVYRDSIRQMGNSGVPVVMQQIDRYATGIAKELMYYDLTFYGSKDKGSFTTLFSNTIKNAYLKNLFEKKPDDASVFVPYNFLEAIRKFPGGDSLIEKLGWASLKPGQFTYIDFWGSWCGPCMAEMPLYPRLIEKLSDKPVDFLFLAVDTEDEKIKEVKEMYGIQGRFVSLTGNETKMLENVLRFSSYPRHFIIDASGMVLNNSISHLRSGDDLSPEVAKQIEKAISVN